MEKPHEWAAQRMQCHCSLCIVRKFIDVLGLYGVYLCGDFFYLYINNRWINQSKMTLMQSDVTAKHACHIFDLSRDIGNCNRIKLFISEQWCWTTKNQCKRERLDAFREIVTPTCYSNIRTNPFWARQKYICRLRKIVEKSRNCLWRNLK